MNDYKVTVKHDSEPIIIEERIYTRKIEAISFASKTFDNREGVIVQISVVPAAYTLSLNKKGSDGRISMVYVDYPVTLEGAQEILNHHADSLVSYILTRD